jgi:hypothetical protein
MQREYSLNVGEHIAFAPITTSAVFYALGYEQLRWATQEVYEPGSWERIKT